MALIKQLQDAANKGVGGAALLEDTQQGQEDDNTSDLGDKESLATFGGRLTGQLRSRTPTRTRQPFKRPASKHHERFNQLID